MAGEVAALNEIQAALPLDAALVTWVDVPPVGPNAADRDGEHWGVVVRSRGIPAFIPIAGTGPDGLWTGDDDSLAERTRTELRRRPAANPSDLRPLVEKLRRQRVGPLAKALGASADGLPPARRLVVLPARAMAGIPVEALLAREDERTVSYAPSATVFKYLREQPRPDRHTGLLALGDPVYARPDDVQRAQAAARSRSAGQRGRTRLQRRDPWPEAGRCNPHVQRNCSTQERRSQGRYRWRSADRRGRVERGPVVPPRSGSWQARPGHRPAAGPEAIAANRAMNVVLMAARGGGEDFEPLPGTRYEVEALAGLFRSDDRPARILLGADASEPELDRLAASGELGRFGFIHMATHGVIDEETPAQSAVILAQTGLPDPLEQVMHQKPAFDGRLSVREIQRGWDLKAELVTLSACETALGLDAGGEGFVGFTQALLMSGTHSICLSLWKVDDTATALLMQRFYANLLGRRPGLTGPMAKAEALREAKAWLRGLNRAEILAVTAEMSGGVERGKGAKARPPAEVAAALPAGGDNDHPYARPHFWAAFVLVGDPD